MTRDLADEIDKLISTTLETHLKASGHEPRCAYDPEWPSPCIISGATDAGETVSWKPVRQTPPSDMFERLSAALSIPLHDDIITWYTRYWSDPLPAKHPEGELTLLLCWNGEDMERLRGNLLGHLMAKQKQRQPLTLFFACTDGDEFMTVDNEDGSVWLERPGRKPIRRLANSLGEFLAALTPLPII